MKIEYLNNVDINEIRAWPFLEAKRIYEFVDEGKRLPENGYILFETGYGPSGLPHIGTFGEVKRTSMVMNILKNIYGLPCKLICFSDDLDGLRKVPSNLPNQEMIAQYIDMPLSSVPDPFGEEESFAHYMNKKLCKFLDRFGFDYEFCSATDYYFSGKFDHMLELVLDNYEKIMDVMLPTLREERQKTYSPFMPICKKTGKVLQLKVEKIDKEAKLIFYKDPETNELISTKVIGGNCKLQWKPDFGMRWAALDVNYEMYGKDHLANGPIYSKICQILGKKPPLQFVFELFLDKDGKKISKSSGNSITIDQWLSYSPQESMSLFMYNAPQRAKRLYFDVIPKHLDEYLTFIDKYHKSEKFEEKINNPVYHIHQGNVPKINNFGISFGLLLNLATVCNPDSPEILWNFISKHNKEANPQNASYLHKMVIAAINYYNDFVKPNKKYLLPTEEYKNYLFSIVELLNSYENNCKDNLEIDPADIQNEIYKIGRESVGKENLREFFKVIYQIILGQEQGPRLGSFFKLYGMNNSINLIKSKIEA